MLTSQHSVSIDMLYSVLVYAERIGLDKNAILEEAGIDPATLQNQEVRIPVEKANHVWEIVEAQACDPDFGLHHAETMRVFVSGDLITTLILNSPDLRGALQRLGRYHALKTDLVKLDLDESEGVASYNWMPISAPIQIGRQYTEAILSMLSFFIQEITRGEVRQQEIHFRHRRPEDISEHERILACPVMFEQPRNQLILRRVDLDHPIRMANPKLLGRLEEIADEMLHELYAPDSWAEQVRSRIAHMLLEGDKPTVGAIAYDLAISVRQLQNKLKEEQTTYRELFDQLRKEIAITYLDRPNIPICDVAFLLGFSAQSAFNHAFKRWTGISPSEYRRA
ncbi:MAG: AraC family transcriptional regulator [Anaerolineae bacterium]|nr:AraC family transcriptional regulator [Anaerolineae bacterium]